MDPQLLLQMFLPPQLEGCGRFPGSAGAGGSGLKYEGLNSLIVIPINMLSLNGKISHLLVLTGQARLAVALVLAGRSNWQGRRFLILARPAGGHFGLDVLSYRHPLVSSSLGPLEYRLERLVDVLSLGRYSE